MVVALASARLLVVPGELVRLLVLVFVRFVPGAPPVDLVPLLFAPLAVAFFVVLVEFVVFPPEVPPVDVLSAGLAAGAPLGSPPLAGFGAGFGAGAGAGFGAGAGAGSFFCCANAPGGRRTRRKIRASG